MLEVLQCALALDGKIFGMVGCSPCRSTVLLAKKGIAWASDDCWWFFVGGMHALILGANVMFIQCKGLTALLSEQGVSLNNSLKTYCLMSQM